MTIADLEIDLIVCAAFYKTVEMPFVEKIEKHEIAKAVLEKPKIVSLKLVLLEPWEGEAAFWIPNPTT